MRYFDSHAHYWDERFENEAEGGTDRLLRSLLSDSVSYIVNVGTSIESSLMSIEQAKKHAHMYAAAGIHPSDASGLPLEETMSALEKLLLPENKIVALGEIGLDYHYEPFDKDEQMAFFKAQMALAERKGLPVIIHDREAHGDSFDVVRSFPGVRGVFHSYSGSAEMAKQLVSLGYMISFSGTVSFKNARSVKDAAAALPHSCVMIETDAPYLTPHPHRGKMNHSGYLAYTSAALAEAWGISEEETAAITESNAKRFFGLCGG